MSFDKIFDLTAGVYLNFYNIYFDAVLQRYVVILDLMGNDSRVHYRPPPLIGKSHVRNVVKRMHEKQ